MIDRDLLLMTRHVLAEDEELLLRWRNNPLIVQGGASKRSVTREEHHHWFIETLKNDKRELFIVEFDGVPQGMVRYDFAPSASSEISIYLFYPFQGRGFGSKIFFSTASDLFVRRGIRTIIARVLRDNIKSQRFFHNLGFRLVESLTEKNLEYYRLDLWSVPHSRPWMEKAEISAAAAVVRSCQIAQGPKVLELERQWCKHMNTPTSAAVGSGMGALRLSLLALEVGPGDDVIVPAYSCVALINAVLALNARPVLADVIPDYWTLDYLDVARRLTDRVKAIIAVHLFGMPANMGALGSFGLPIIEDCAHGIGGFADGKSFGSIGTLSITSFYATKMLAAGEGGIITANDPNLINLVRQARDYGDQSPDGRYLNDKMTDIEAALALVQLNRLSEILTRREKRAKTYHLLLKPLSDVGLIELPVPATGRIWYRYVVRLKQHMASDVVKRMKACGVNAEQPVWDLRQTKMWNDSFIQTNLALDRVLSLPLYPDLSKFEQNLVCAALQHCLEYNDN